MPATEPLFRALADATRQRILRVLSAEELSVTELVEVLDQPQSTVSRHLKVLRDAGLLVDRRSKTTVMHSTCPIGPEERIVAASQGHDAGRIGNGGSHEVAAGLAGLRSRMLAWVSQEPLEQEVRERLDRVLHRRRAGGADFFETVGARWDQLRVEAFGDTFHLEALTWLLPRKWTVADVGTGTGYLLPLLSARFARVIAVDPSPSMLEAAHNRPELKGASNVSFRAGSLDRLPIEDGELDLAIASLVLHHVADPTAALRELRRCLRSEGRLLAIEQEHHHHAEFHERMGDRWWGFEPAEITQYCREAGFADVQVRPLTTARASIRRGMDVPKLFAVVAA